MSRNKRYDQLIEIVRDDFFETNFEDFNIESKKNNLYKYESVSTLYKMKSVYEAKDSDYSENDLPMGNLMESQELGILPWKGVLLRIGDKKRRIGSFLNKKSFKVKDEALNDTLVDMSNYSLLGRCLFENHYGSKNFEELQIIWSRMTKYCVVAKVLFEHEDDKEAWAIHVWPNILKCYNILADFAKKH
jgi:hypothetical protein